MHLTLIDVPYDSGRRDERTGAGPPHLLASGLVDDLRRGGHHVERIPVRLDDAFFPAEVAAGVELMRRVALEVARAREANRLPIVLSGNCNVTVGTVCGLGVETTGVLWFDAHGDLNWPDVSPSGFFDGMGYAMLLGRGWEALAATIPGFAPLAAERAALLAARDLDRGEEDLIADNGLLRLSTEALRTERGKSELGDFGRRSRRLCVHVDLDAFDPRVVRGNGLATPGGVDVGDVLGAVEAAARQTPIGAIAIASYDPAVDREDRGPGVVRSLLEGLLGRDPETATDP